MCPAISSDLKPWDYLERAVWEGCRVCARGTCWESWLRENVMGFFPKQSGLALPKVIRGLCEGFSVAVYLFASEITLHLRDWKNCEKRLYIFWKRTGAYLHAFVHLCVWVVSVYGSAQLYLRCVCNQDDNVCSIQVQILYNTIQTAASGAKRWTHRCLDS